MLFLRENCERRHRKNRLCSEGSSFLHHRMGVVMERGQIGGRVIRNLGYRLESVGIADAMGALTGTVRFRAQA